MTYNRKFVLPFCFALGLILAAAADAWAAAYNRMADKLIELLEAA